jgi:hypothetical protein
MSNLSKLIQMQKAQSNANSAATSKAPDSNVVKDGGAPAVAGNSDSESQPEAAKDSPPRMGLNLLRKSSTPASPPRKPVAEAAPEKPNPATSDSFSLDDLASFDAGSIEPIRESATRQGFIDEIEATAPDRELPADLSAQQLGFVEQLDGIYQVLNDADMFAQCVRVLMIELQENPEYIKLVSDQDVHTMIRGMRNSMGLARIRKQEKSRKTGTKTKTAAQKKSRVSDDVMDLLNSLGADDD